MGLKEYTHKGLDTIVLGVFNRGKYYRHLGVEYRKFADKKLDEMFTLMNPNSKQYLLQRLKDYKNRAYLEVQGQTVLIDMDICGIDVYDAQPKANEAAFAVGLVWYVIKLLDNYIDENRLEKEEFKDFLKKILEHWKKSMPCKSKDGDLINATLDLLYTGYAGDSPKYLNEIEAVLDAEINFRSSLLEEKIATGKKIGSASAILTRAIARQYVPEFPNGNHDFILEQGITGKIFDDFKDYYIDRTEGHGYPDGWRLKLLKETFRHFYGHFKALPDWSARWRNANFIALASMFHVEELLGLKEKS